MSTRFEAWDWESSGRRCRRFLAHTAFAAAPNVCMVFLMAMNIQASTLSKFAAAAAMVIEINCGGFWWVGNTKSLVAAAMVIEINCGGFRWVGIIKSLVAAAKKVRFTVFMDMFLYLMWYWMCWAFLNKITPFGKLIYRLPSKVAKKKQGVLSKRSFFTLLCNQPVLAHPVVQQLFSVKFTNWQ